MNWHRCCCAAAACTLLLLLLLPPPPLQPPRPPPPQTSASAMRSKQSCEPLRASLACAPAVIYPHPLQVCPSRGLRRIGAGRSGWPPPPASQAFVDCRPSLSPLASTLSPWPSLFILQGSRSPVPIRSLPLSVPCSPGPLLGRPPLPTEKSWPQGSAAWPLPGSWRRGALGYW